MNRNDAKKRSLAETDTVGDLRAMISKAGARSGMSRVNPIIPLQKALEIYTGALKGREDGERAVRPDRPVLDGLLVQNILRDCA